MKSPRLFWAPAALVLTLGSCDKPQSAASESTDTSTDDLSSQRAAIEEERLAFEQQRIDEERAALEEEKAALRAEREARLAAREDDMASRDQTLEERQQELDEREDELNDREGELGELEGILTDRELELAGREALDDWAPEPTGAFSEPVADYDTFYDDLQPYGSWFETPDYGYVYQPTVVVQDVSWRPYTRGRWACSNQGWTWVSEEPFGWATFHYGRWALLNGRGWVWVPGDEWAPSWVCWRESREHVGWAPLPPETLGYRGRGWGSTVEADFGIGAGWFSFVQRRHMADPLRTHCLPLARNRDYIRSSRNITNIQFQNNRVIIGGPRYAALRRDVRKPWPLYQLQKDHLHALRHPKQRNTIIHGNLLEVFAPNMGARWNAALRPKRVAAKWSDVQVSRGKDGVKPEWQEKFKERRREHREEAQRWNRKSKEFVEAREQLARNRDQVAEAQRRQAAKLTEIAESRRQQARVRQVESGRGRGLGDSGTAPVVRERRSRAGEQTPPQDSPHSLGGNAGREPETPQVNPRPRTTRAEREAAPDEGRQRGNPRAEAGPSTTRNRNGNQPQMRGNRQDLRRQQQEAVREQMENSRRQQQNMDAENARRQQQEVERQKQEAQKRQRQEEIQRKRQEEQIRREQQMQEKQERLARQQQEQAQRQRELQRQNEERARQQAEERIRLQAEQARRQQQEQARRQEEARRMREEQQTRQRQEERAREQAERSQRQEEARRQQEENAKQQERARRQDGRNTRREPPERSRRTRGQ